MRRYADRRDTNEPAIIAYLERLGCKVAQVSQKGLPDLMVSQGPLKSIVIMLEVKSGKQGKLTADQKIFFQKFGNSFVYVVRSIQDVKEILRLFMPVRIYECAEHGIFEVKQKFSEEPLTVCPKCGKLITQKYSVPSIIYKGNGWYNRDANSRSGE